MKRVKLSPTGAHRVTMYRLHSAQRPRNVPRKQNEAKYIFSLAALTNRMLRIWHSIEQQYPMRIYKNEFRGVFRWQWILAEVYVSDLTPPK